MKPKHFEACELLSYGGDEHSFTIVFHDENNREVYATFPVHEDFMLAFMRYKSLYTEHINKILNA